MRGGGDHRGLLLIPHGWLALSMSWHWWCGVRAQPGRAVRQLMSGPKSPGGTGRPAPAVARGRHGSRCACSRRWRRPVGRSIGTSLRWTRTMTPAGS